MNFKNCRFLLCLQIAFISFYGNIAYAQAQQVPKKPNIIFILSDDHAYQTIGAYGAKIARTPNIDRLAREGVRFNNAIVTNAICGPSRATFLTGKYSHKNGYPLNEQKFDTSQTLFPQLLQSADYQTAWLGKWHLGNLPKGFDYYNILNGQGQYFNPDFISSNQDTVQKEGYVTNIITDLATGWLDGRDKNKPFFLVVGEKGTHRSWEPDLQDLGAYDQIHFPLPSTFYDNYANRLAAKDQDMTIDKTMNLTSDLKIHASFKKPATKGQTGQFARLNDEQRKVYADYYGRISREFDSLKLMGKALVEWKYQRYMKDYLATANSLDRNIGKILNYLDANGLSENTIVIYASDNGFYMGEHGWFDKRFIYEESIHVPLIVRYPKTARAGTTIDKIVLNNDWAPTILDAAGLKIPDDMQGRSFLPLIKNEQSVNNWRKDAYYHYYEYPQPHHVHPHFGIRTERYTLARFYGELNSWELFDNKSDPKQLKNLYGLKGNDKLTEDLKARLKKLIVEFDDSEALKVFDQKI